MYEVWHEFWLDPNLCPYLVRYQEELPSVIAGRSDKHVTQSELMKLMEWKLTVSVCAWYADKVKPSVL